MKKYLVLLFAVVMVSFIMLPQAEAARPGGLPDLVIDSSIPDCAGGECVIELKVHFDSDKAVVKEKYHNEIKKVADFMKQNPQTTAVIEGHTDGTHTAEYNLRLSEARANSVRQYLVNNFGIRASRLKAVGYGLTRPIATNDTEEGRQKNRRVQAVIKTVTK
jgi:OOP family OmpA-OmpF porin